MAHILGGDVVRKGNTSEKEYGKTSITYEKSAIFEGITKVSMDESYRLNRCFTGRGSSQ